nr:reverse transcriptase domain-containing protein [Tanacetum cinerariifolium]
MPPKRTSTYEALVMTQAVIKKFVVNSVTAALEAQAVIMANTSNPNRNTGPTGTLVAKKGNYKEFISCQPFYFNGMEGAVGLIRWRFQELAVLYLNMVPNTKKLLEAFIEDAFYDIEMADGNLVTTNTVIKGATLTLLNQPFEIDVMPIKLGSFNVVIGMDWLSKYHAKILCDEKDVHIPIDSETLIIPEEEVKREENRRYPVVREFPNVFLEDLPGLPHIRQVEFQIELILGAVPVAHVPYRLAPLEM